jgi:putative ABC transport system ATP-binding protein
MQDVRRTYTRRQSVVEAVRGVDLEVREGEVVGLVGRSGSGKTTLLSIAAGFEKADGGRSSVDGASTDETPPPWDRLAIVPQRLGLLEDLSIRENIEYPSRLSDRLERDRVFVDELLERFGLTELQHRMPTEVSLGEQQRAALARALILAPRLVLADEPTGHQDRVWARRVLEVVRQVAEDGTACLAASHDREVAAAVDRVLMMADGQLVDAS